jgi:hypothetical protein
VAGTIIKSNGVQIEEVNPLQYGRIALKILKKCAARSYLFHPLITHRVRNIASSMRRGDRD